MPTAEQGPIDGVDVPYLGREYMMLTIYERDGSELTQYIYRFAGGRCVYMPKATRQANGSNDAN